MFLRCFFFFITSQKASLLDDIQRQNNQNEQKWVGKRNLLRVDSQKARSLNNCHFQRKLKCFDSKEKNWKKRKHSYWNLTKLIDLSLFSWKHENLKKNYRRKYLSKKVMHVYERICVFRLFDWLKRLSQNSNKKQNCHKLSTNLTLSTRLTAMWLFFFNKVLCVLLDCLIE